MNLLRIAMLSSLVLFFVAGAFADPIPIGVDPVILTGGTPDPPVPASIITPNFTIVSPTGTSPATSGCDLYQFGVLTSVSPACFFQNNINPRGTGETITQLTFDISGVSPATVSCGFLTDTTGSPFSDCSVAPLGSGGTQVLFSNGSIPFGNDFSLGFEGFASGASFAATATTPEPGTVVLLLSGVGALWFHRRLRFQ
jgi:hypothetical protein